MKIKLRRHTCVTLANLLLVVMTSLKKWLHIEMYPPANQINISCVRIKTFPVVESKDFLSSNHKISCVRIKRFRALESKDFACSNQEISCVRMKRFPAFKTSRVLQSRHVLCSNQEMSCAPIKRCPVFESRYFLVPEQHHFSKIRPATFGRILAIVPGFFRFVTRNEMEESWDDRQNSPKNGM